MDHLMTRICDWLRANDVAPGRVPRHEVPTVDRENGTLRIYLYDEPRVLAPGGYEVVGRTHTVPLLVDPPADLDDWLDRKVQFR